MLSASAEQAEQLAVLLLSLYQDNPPDPEQLYRQLNQNQSGDPVKAARALMNLAESADPPGRIYLGVDSFAAIGRKLQAVADEAQAWRAPPPRTPYED